MAQHRRRTLMQLARAMTSIVEDVDLYGGLVPRHKGSLAWVGECGRFWVGVGSRAATCAGEREAQGEAYDLGGVVPDEAPCGGGGAFARIENLTRQRRVDFGMDRASCTLASASTIA